MGMKGMDGMSWMALDWGGRGGGSSHEGVQQKKNEKEGDLCNRIGLEPNDGMDDGMTAGEPHSTEEEKRSEGEKKKKVNQV